MKKLTLVGNIIKCTLGVGLLAAIVKLVATFYYGYYRVDGSYGGAFYYNWRVQYLDKKLPGPKSIYTVIKLLEQPENEDLKRYVKFVQDVGKKEEGIFPYYAYGLPDTFVLMPEKTWRLFDTKSKMNLEFQFLEFRGRFISKMYDVKYDKNSAYFKDSKPPANMSEEGIAKWKASALKPILKVKYFKRLPSADVKAHFADKKNQFIFETAEFENIVKNIMMKKADYRIDFADQQAKMTPEFQKDIMPLVGKIFKGFNISVADVNQFWTRAMTIRPTPMDVHILNRISLYFLYTSSYLDADKLGNKAYDTLKKAYDELEALEKKEGKLDETRDRKFKSIGNRMYALRSELILNKASALLASVFGTRGPVLEKDERWFLEWLGNPDAATVGNTKDRSDITIFDDQMKKYLSI